MAKPRKPNTARKPPEPSDSHADIEDWIRRVMPDLHPIVKRLDELICETIPGLQYAVKWKKLKTLEEAQGSLMRKWINMQGACAVGNEDP